MLTPGLEALDSVDFVTEECGGSSGIYLYLYEISGLMSPCREDYHLILRSATEKFLGVALRASLYKHFKLLADVSVVRFLGKFVLEGDHPVKTFDFYLFGNVVGKMLGGKCAGAFGIFEHESGVKAYKLHQRKCLGEIFFRFVVETGEEIGCDAGVGEDTSDGSYAIEIPFAGIFTIHRLQYGI